MDGRIVELYGEFKGAWTELGKALSERFHVHTGIQVAVKIGGHADTATLYFGDEGLTVTTEMEGTSSPIEERSLDLQLWMVRHVPELVRKLRLLEDAREHDIAGATDVLRGLIAEVKG